RRPCTTAKETARPPRSPQQRTRKARRQNPPSGKAPCREALRHDVRPQVPARLRLRLPPNLLQATWARRSSDGDAQTEVLTAPLPRAPPAPGADPAPDRAPRAPADPHRRSRGERLFRRGFGRGRRQRRGGQRKPEIHLQRSPLVGDDLPLRAPLAESGAYDVFA